MSPTAPARARRQQQIEALCAAAARAISGQADLHYRGGRLHRGTRPLPCCAPHLHPSLDEDDFGSFRGAADGLALRLAHSDAQLHARLQPGDATQALVFDLLEQLRVESLAAAHLPGVRHNLRHRFERWSLAYDGSGLNESASGLLFFTVALMSRSRVTGEPPLEALADRIEATRGMLVPRLGGDLLGLRRHRHHQNAYAPHALRIAQKVAVQMQAAQDTRANGDARAEALHAAFQRLLDRDGQADEGLGTAGTGARRVLGDATAGYRVFTRAHDRESAAASLARPAQLAEHRTRLDELIAAQRIPLARLARELHGLLAEPARDGWDSAQEQGRIDGRRLALLVGNPGERRVFRTDREQPVADAVVSFLIDCSGSMRAHIESVALLVDVFARALEMAGVASEILGFSTLAWGGGRARRDWQRAGRPPEPGRLNEVHHLVFKSADLSWRRARPGMAALLKADLFREGIDGEAVHWACTRLQALPQARRFLLVVSDGSPMDSATLLANDAQCLDQHLRAVVHRHEQAGDVALGGLGVGLDLSPYYRRCLALDLTAPPGMAEFLAVLNLLARLRKR